MPRLLRHAGPASPARFLRAILISLLLLAGLASIPRTHAAAAADARTYTVGVLDDNPPFSFRDTDGQIKGYAVDLLAAIEARLDVRLERRDGPTAEINRAFELGELDMLQSYVPNDERRRFANFSMPYLRMSGTIFVRRGEDSITRIEDLRGRKVLVHKGSAGARILTEEGLADSIVHVDSVEEGFLGLEEGTGDATLASRITGLTLIQRRGLRNVVAVGDPVPGYLVNYCFAIRKGLDDLTARVEEQLALLDRPEASGISPKQRIYDRWFGFLDPRFSSTQIAIAVSGGLGLALLVAVWAMLRQRRLRHEIARQADALRASEEGYRTVFESTLHGLIVFERAAAPGRWEIVQLNPAARRILGEPAVAAGRPTFAEAFPADEPLAFRLAGALTATAPGPFEQDRSRADVPSWVDIAVTPLGDDRRLVAIRDITESRVAAERLRQSEAQLRQNQKLEAIGTLASGVAHDFNNVLTAIVGNVELMRFDLPANHPAAPTLTEISQATERARHLVRQILTFSRKSESRREVLQAARVIKETLRFVSATAPSTIEFHHRIGDRSPEIEIDPTHLHQVLMNLCTNAVHAMQGRSGVIEIAEDAVVVSDGDPGHPAGLRPGEYLVLTVRDTGAGMPPEVLQHLFEPFFTTKPSGEGTGLGLAVVHGIVNSSGGAVSVLSKPGQGTTFRLYFPASTRPRVASPEEEDSIVPDGHGERILLVDDEPAITQTASRLLERLGYAVRPFTQPAEALAEFHRCRGAFDVVLTDLTMPQMSGIEFATRLRVVAPDIPVLLMSGFINDREMALARTGHITRIIDKPLTLATLGQAVASCLPRRH